MNTPYGQEDTWTDCNGISGWMITRCWLPGQEKAPISDNGTFSPQPISPTPTIPGSPPSTDTNTPGTPTIWDKERNRLGGSRNMTWLIPVGVGVVLIGIAVGVGTAKKRKRRRT